MEQKKEIPAAAKYGRRRLEQSVKRLERLLKLEAPAVIVAGEIALMLNFAYLACGEDLSLKLGEIWIGRARAGAGFCDQCENRYEGAGPTCDSCEREMEHWLDEFCDKEGNPK